MTLEVFFKTLLSHFIRSLQILSNPLQMLTNSLFYRVPTSVETSRFPIDNNSTLIASVRLLKVARVGLDGIR